MLAEWLLVLAKECHLVAQRRELAERFFISQRQNGLPFSWKEGLARPSTTDRWDEAPFQTGGTVSCLRGG
jgi:hypothetical protein